MGIWGLILLAVLSTTGAIWVFTRRETEFERRLKRIEDEQEHSGVIAKGED